MVLSFDTVSPSYFFFPFHCTERIFPSSILGILSVLSVFSTLLIVKAAVIFIFLLKVTRFLIISTDLVQYCT